MFEKLRELVAQLEGPVKNYPAAKGFRITLQEIKKEAQNLRIAIIDKVKKKEYDVE